MGVVSIGVAGALDSAVIAEVAAKAEQSGFHALWMNDTPGGDSLAGLAAAAAVTETLVLATGVIPLDRRPARDIAADVRALRLPEHRLILGIGSGGVRQGALDLVRDAAHELRAQTSAGIVVGALGPKMRRLAAEESDGELLNWVTPARAAEQRAELREVAPEGRVIVYARTSFDPDARDRLESEAERYGRVPSYAANFQRLGIGPLDTVLPRPGEVDVSAGVRAYTDVVDQLVLRAVTATDELDDYLAFLELAAESLSHR